MQELENLITLPELLHILDMIRFKRHGDYDILARIVTGEGVGEFVSMTDLNDEGGDPRPISGSGDTDLDSEFVITHLPIGLGYETQ